MSGPGHKPSFKPLFLGNVATQRPEGRDLWSDEDENPTRDDGTLAGVFGTWIATMGYLIKASYGQVARWELGGKLSVSMSFRQRLKLRRYEDIDTPSKFNIATEKLPKPNRKVVFQPSFFGGELFNFRGVDLALIPPIVNLSGTSDWRKIGIKTWKFWSTGVGLEDPAEILKFRPCKINMGAKNGGLESGRWFSFSIGWFLASKCYFFSGVSKKSSHQHDSHFQC